MQLPQIFGFTTPQIMFCCSIILCMYHNQRPLTPLRKCPWLTLKRLSDVQNKSGFTEPHNRNTGQLIASCLGHIDLIYVAQILNKYKIHHIMTSSLTLLIIAIFLSVLARAHRISSKILWWREKSLIQVKCIAQMSHQIIGGNLWSVRSFITAAVI